MCHGRPCTDGHLTAGPTGVLMKKICANPATWWEVREGARSPLQPSGSYNSRDSQGSPVQAGARKGCLVNRILDFLHYPRWESAAVPPPPKLLNPPADRKWRDQRHPIYYWFIWLFTACRCFAERSHLALSCSLLIMDWSWRDPCTGFEERG